MTTVEFTNPTAGAALAFVEFPKIARLNRECVITEKLDGTNACVAISEDGTLVCAQSRNRLLVGDHWDSFGFRGWVEKNADLLREKLGPGHHFGEWWGGGIQRGYGLQHGKQFSLFNVHRWREHFPQAGPESAGCISVVPVLYEGLFTSNAVEMAIIQLRNAGSVAVPGWMKPEGVVIYHKAADTLFKVTLEKDESPKGRTE